MRESRPVNGLEIALRKLEALDGVVNGVDRMRWVFQST